MKNKLVMESNGKTNITVQATVDAPLELVWKCWNNPEDIVKWNNASDDWHTTRAENDLRVGGKFVSRMEAKDGSFGFDFEGIYTAMKKNELIEYVLADERKVCITFTDLDGQTRVTETFDPENVYPQEHQKAGWQSILNNFKKYVEEKSK
jgi:uncharacterized protein YndB with AHSA1/START domain